MYQNALVVSKSLEFRALIKNIFRSSALHIDCLVASDAATAESMLGKERFDFIVADDDTVKNFVEQSCGELKLHGGAFVLKLRTGGRLSIRNRESPFQFIEILFEDLAQKEHVSEQLLAIFASLPVRKIEFPGSASHQNLAKKDGLAPAQPVQTHGRKVNPELFLPEIIVIGASTGGPEALERFFTAIPFQIVVPVIVVQHMPAGFTKGLADRLARVSGWRFVEAKNNEAIEPGCIYIAPGDFHLKLKKEGDAVLCVLDKGPLINSVRPAVDPLFDSAAAVFGHKVMSIVFTGMGEDGAAGARAVKEHGGCVAIQDEASCVVFGMPGAILQLGIQDYTGAPETLAMIVGRQMNLKGAPGVRRNAPEILGDAAGDLGTGSKVKIA